MIVRIPTIIYTGVLVACHIYTLSPYLLLGLYLRESNLHWDARGDWGPAEPGRFAGDPYWTPNREGLWPHAFGLGQLHVDGAGAPHRPAELLDITNNIAWSAEYLHRCLAAAAGSWPDAVSAYNQGIAGWQARGRELNAAYVADVLGHYEVLSAATIE